jgi:Uncharacterised protein family (UPF0137)
MAKFNSLLNLRLKQKNNEKTKMTALAERSKAGNLSSFSGVFRISSLTSHEKNIIEEILKNFREDQNYDFENDLKSLMTITSEVKAITNQAVILHGERIKRAQEVLKSYKEGAFTAWLMATYGNRQTPYNFLQYYEFYSTIPQDLHPIIDQMPRQAIYTLASRNGEIEKKLEIVKNYQGQAKQELLEIIRDNFPLAENDKRVPNNSSHVIALLRKVRNLVRNPSFLPSDRQKALIEDLKAEINSFI